MLTSIIIKALDSLGYSKEIAVKRSWIGKNISKGSTIFHRRKYGGNIDVILTGSRREGIATWLDNDVDQMFVDTEVICTEYENVDLYNNDNYYVVFAIDTATAPAGYTFLKLVRINTNDAEIPIELKEALTEYKGFIFLRNDVTLKAVSPLLGAGRVQKQLEKEKGGWLEKTIKLNVEKTGPSVPYSLSILDIEKTLHFDDCLAFKCYAPSLLKTWCVRVRKYDWPSKRLVKQIEEMPGHVVPVGIKGHQDQLFQWRVCFTQAEIELVQTFNDTQIKVYVIMKHLSKHVFKNVCGGITSYVMKNVLFWISEEVPMVEFEAHYFPERIHHALCYLKECISMRKLPSYMIANRNLLEDRVSIEERDNLLQKIEHLILKGPCVALEIPEVLKEVNNHDKESYKDKVRRKELIHLAFLSPYAQPPNDIADFLIKMLDAPSEQEIVYLYIRHVFPYIKKYNPQNLFTPLIENLNQLIIQFCLKPKL